MRILNLICNDCKKHVDIVTDQDSANCPECGSVIVIIPKEIDEPATAKNKKNKGA